MEFQKKTAALFFACLIAWISVAYPVAPRLIPEEQANPAASFSLLLPVGKVYYLQNCGAPSNTDGWKNEVKIPGFLFRRLETDITPPRLPHLKKIFVNHLSVYTPCKAVLLFPFHEFS